MESFLSKLIKSTDGEKCIRSFKPDQTDYMAHVLHSVKKYTPPELKPHVSRILRSATPRIAKSRMLQAHSETGGSFFDFLKKAGSAVSNIAQKAGNQAIAVSNKFFDKAVPLAQKGLTLAKPYIKEHGPSLLGKAAEMIPVVGPVAGPVVKKGAEMLFNKFF